MRRCSSRPGAAALSCATAHASSSWPQPQCFRRRICATIVPMPTRALIFTASIGAGHDLPAEMLATALRERGATAEVVDGLQVGGPIARAIIGGGSSLDTKAGNVAFEVSYA